uniref:Uncharacterized protein n=1 Tax=viral metagenome TaxID=1070528 RepID=A0A6M3JCR7_9ZZZZ
MKITKTMVVPGRVEICSFASLVRAYEKEGLRLRSKSDVIWQAVEQLVVMYARKHGEEPFVDIREAVTYMTQIGMPLDTCTRAIQSIATAKICQDAAEDYGLENLQTMMRKVTLTSMRKNSVIEPPQGPLFRSEVEAYNTKVDLLKQHGIVPPWNTFDEYLEDIKRQEVQPVSINTQPSGSGPIDEVEYAEKERQKMADIKAALDPDALRAAMGKSAA